MKPLALFACFALALTGCQAPEIPDPCPASDDNHTLHRVHEGLRVYPSYAKCEDTDWPDTRVCNGYARAAASSIQAVDSMMEKGK